jgi:hypothetical protein
VVPNRGMLVNGNPETKQFQEEFVDKVVSTLTNPERKRSYQDKAREWARTQDWSLKALEWKDMIDKDLAARSANLSIYPS